MNICNSGYLNFVIKQVEKGAHVFYACVHTKNIKHVGKLVQKNIRKHTTRQGLGNRNKSFFKNIFQGSSGSLSVGKRRYIAIHLMGEWDDNRAIVIYCVMLYLSVVVCDFVKLATNILKLATNLMVFSAYWLPIFQNWLPIF